MFTPYLKTTLLMPRGKRSCDTLVRSIPFERCGHLAMDTQKFWDRLRISPTHTTLSRDPKICNGLLLRLILLRVPSTPSVKCTNPRYNSFSGCSCKCRNGAK